MIVNCGECDEEMCSNCDGDQIDGVYVCDNCLDDRDENVKPGEQPAALCGKCGCKTVNWIEKQEGIRCIRCAHVIEIERLRELGNKHDAANCPVCTPPKAA